MRHSNYLMESRFDAQDWRLILETFREITADEAWRKAAESFKRPDLWSLQPGRGGPTWELLPACFVVEDPRQRWVLSRTPAMSVPFALVEVIGIISGRRDSSYLNYFNPRLPKYAGSGESYPGAYGFRLRHHFGVDQLERVCSALERNTQTRQAVLQIWDPMADIPHVDGSPTSADIPCNIASMLKIRNGRLFWTQIMRSNDLYRGTPYNFVQFTILQEVLAGWLDVDTGPYTHLSDSLHVYDADLKFLESAQVPKLPVNQDDLRLPMAASRTAWARLNQSVDSLIVPDLAEKDLEDIAMSSSETPMRNMLLIVSADSARRRGFFDLATELSQRCTNPVLSLGWGRWYQRTMHRAAVSH